MPKVTTCSSGKKVFLSLNLGEEALLSAHVQFNFGQGKGPVAVYQCDECGQFHLTSRGNMSVRLKDFLSSADYKRQRQAAEWTDKLKHKY